MAEPPREAKRARTEETEETAPASAESLFTSFRAELDAHHDLNERLIRFSRDVTAASKKIIFLLQRHNPILDQKSGEDGPAIHPSNLAILDEAQAKLAEVTQMILQQADLELLGPVPEAQPSTVKDMEATRRVVEAPVARQPAAGGGFKGKQRAAPGQGAAPSEIMLPSMSRAGRYADRYDRAYGPGLEEYIEAASFLHFVRHKSLMQYADVQKPFGDRIDVSPRRYLLGISDLSGELMRYATNAVGAGDVTGDICVAAVLSTLREIRSSLERFVTYVGRDLVKKQAVTDQSVRKIEGIAYALRVRASEPGTNPEALQEMARRALSVSAPSDPQGDENDL